MKIAQLLYFQTVCCYNSVTKAASVLNVAQPSISAAIRSLEEEFGVSLFHRVKQRLILTSEGAFFLKYVNEILEMTGNLEQQMLDLGQNRRYLRVAIPPMTATFAFNRMFLEYRRQNPDAYMEIVESPSSRNLLAVAEESVDVALANSRPTVNEQLNILSLRNVRIVLCVSPDHRLAKEPGITIDMLRDEPLILSRKGSRQNDLIFQCFAEVGITPNVLLYSSQVYTIRQFVESGCAAAFIFDGLLDLFDDLVKIPVPGLPGHTVDLVWKKEQFLNNRNRYLFQEVEQFVRFVQVWTARELKTTS